AYWASLLEPGEASSYLLDAAEMTAAIEDTVFNGSYYYGIHVDSQLTSPDPENMNEFLTGGDSRLADFLTGIQNNSMDDAGSTNPRAEVDSPPSAFDFDAMNPGRVFTMDSVQYRYLEDMEDGNHMIIRNDSIRNTSPAAQPQLLLDFYDALTPAVQAMVQPVSIPVEVPGISDEAAAPWSSGGGSEGSRWLPAEWEDVRFNDIRADRTAVNTGGTPQAFALSMADVVHLSTETGPFPNYIQRMAAVTRHTWWWLRTPAASGGLWRVTWSDPALVGQLFGTANPGFFNHIGGVRPALIINQAN
ncbi:hypothetical protein MKK30_09920, partial [Lactococcus formosensis]